MGSDACESRVYTSGDTKRMYRTNVDPQYHHHHASKKHEGVENAPGAVVATPQSVRPHRFTIRDPDPDSEIALKHKNSQQNVKPHKFTIRDMDSDSEFALKHRHHTVPLVKLPTLHSVVDNLQSFFRHATACYQAIDSTADGTRNFAMMNAFKDMVIQFHCVMHVKNQVTQAAFKERMDQFNAKHLIEVFLTQLANIQDVFKILYGKADISWYTQGHSGFTPMVTASRVGMIASITGFMGQMFQGLYTVEYLS